MQGKRMSLRKAYYIIFTCLIVIPFLLVLVVSLGVLSHQYKQKAVETIERAQDSVVAELTADVDFMSMRLSQLIHVNDNEILNDAAHVNAAVGNARHAAQKKLENAGNLILEPVRDVISVSFYMRDGDAMFLRNEIRRSQEELRTYPWYQSALKTESAVEVGYYQTKEVNDLYVGGRKNLLVLVFAVAPDEFLDRSGRIEMVTIYQLTGAGDAIMDYNHGYQKGQNRLGIMRIVDAQGTEVFAPEALPENFRGYTCVRTPVQLGDATWYVESYIRTWELIRDFMNIGVAILLVAGLIFVLVGYCSNYFLKRIIRPIETLSDGLKQVEDGNLDLHLAPAGQMEIRSVIHQFNAMVRSLKALVEDYEKRVRKAGKTPGDYFSALIREEMSPEQVQQDCPEFFLEPYLLLEVGIESLSGEKLELATVRRMVEDFERNPRFTARCLACIESPLKGFLSYRVMEEEYEERVRSLMEEFQNFARREHDIDLGICVGTLNMGADSFAGALQQLKENESLRFLYGQSAVVVLENKQEYREILQELMPKYRNLAQTLYAADEKNYVVEKEALFEQINGNTDEQTRRVLYAVILAVAERFAADGILLSDIFNQRYNYVEKLERLMDTRSMKMWLTNWMNWILDYSSSKVSQLENDVIVKTKRYLADHYDDTELSLVSVAEYVGLNEKYLSNRFTKETGETLSNYLTQLRIQKAKELLRTTNFKVYEIAEMAGYRNTEHFTRMFKKIEGISPAQFRKGEKK